VRAPVVSERHVRHDVLKPNSSEDLTWTLSFESAYVTISLEVALLLRQL